MILSSSTYLSYLWEIGIPIFFVLKGLNLHGNFWKMIGFRKKGAALFAKTILSPSGL
jgi:hypothetical protein